MHKELAFANPLLGAHFKILIPAQEKINNPVRSIHFFFKTNMDSFLYEIKKPLFYKKCL